MKAFFLVKNASPSDSFELRDVAIPEPKEGEVRIKVSAFGLNYSDVMARQGLYRDCPPLPCIIGYDVEGVVDEVGSDVTKVKKGDQVFALTRFGGYAEYACTSEMAVNVLPSDAPVGVGCALATQNVTAYHAVIHCQTLMPNEKVLIHAAAGGVGTALIQLAKWKGCTVIGVVGGKEKVEYLKSMSVEHIIDHHQVDYMDYINDHFGGKVDVVFDNIGGSSFKKGKSILAKGGRIISFGAASLSGKHGIINLLRLVFGFGFFSPLAYLGKSQSLIGINMLRIADNRPDIISHEFAEVASFYKQRILNPHVGKVFHHDQLPKAHEWMEKRNSIGKVVVTW
ncbi:MAG TPA: zinc-binding dehydrogenase [Saprospiraceae bacterium]|nr:zinc-binding dehydrogenase [Saprospiraceae bacterium]